MATKFSVYKHCKTDAGWRYCKAAFYPNGKIKPNIVLVRTKEEKHTEGSYFLNHLNQGIAVGDDALEAQRDRMLKLNQLEYERLSGKVSAPAIFARRTSLVTAAEKYLSNCEARGLTPKTIRAYRSAVDPFVAQCQKPCVEAWASRCAVGPGGRKRQPKESTCQRLLRLCGWVRLGFQASPSPRLRRSDLGGTLIDRKEKVEFGRLRRCEKLAIFQSGQPDVTNCLAIVLGQRVQETFIDNSSIRTRIYERASKSCFAPSRAATANSCETVGNPSRNSSSVSPPSR
ncbi:MAG: hypothetical protein QOG55_2583 [Acidobacteriaceae bacterium]|jgi:hypothetical protein|nr:hypothetical protein [Acidobacteriaceae bacterium]